MQSRFFLADQALDSRRVAADDLEITVQMSKVSDQGGDRVIGGGKGAVAYGAMRGAGGFGVSPEQAERDQTGALLGGQGGEVGVLGQGAFEIGNPHTGLSVKGAQLVAPCGEGAERLLTIVLLRRRPGVVQSLAQ